MVSRFQEADFMKNVHETTQLNIEGFICPRCGIGTLSPQQVTETLRVGVNAVQVTVAANVCDWCEEHWFDLRAQNIIDTAIRHLLNGDRSHLKAIGEVYQVS
jgi:hypothetical protein